MPDRVMLCSLTLLLVKCTVLALWLITSSTLFYIDTAASKLVMEWPWRREYLSCTYILLLSFTEFVACQFYTFGKTFNCSLDESEVNENSGDLSALLAVDVLLNGYVKLLRYCYKTEKETEHRCLMKIIKSHNISTGREKFKKWKIPSYSYMHSSTTV